MPPVTLTPEKAHIFRITHIENMRWISKHGVHCRSSDKRDPNFKEIGNPELIEKRAAVNVPIAPGGTLSDYVPFYFTPFSPMLLNIKSGRGVPQLPMSDIVILVSSLHRLSEMRTSFVFTDRHAKLVTARFSSDLAHLDRICWDQLTARDFKRDNNNLEKVERYQAEALVHRHVPLDRFHAVICHSPKCQTKVAEFMDGAECSTKVISNPNWFF